MRKYSELDEEILHLHNRVPRPSNSDISRLLIAKYPEKGYTWNPLRQYINIFFKKRKFISNENGEKSLIVEVGSSSSSNEYKKKDTPRFVLSAWNQDTGLMMDIDEYCAHYNLPRQDITSYKLVSHTGTPFYNIVFRENTEDPLYRDFDEAIDRVVEKYITTVKVKKKREFFSIETADRLIYSDVHVGMNVNPNGYGLYGGKWDEEELLERCEEMVSTVIRERKSGTLYIDDLGDFLDGWNGETTRGGHKLPQNMDNEQAFDVGLKFKMHIIDNLIPYFDEIVVRNVCNDNHAGSFAYVLNSAYEKIIKAKYGNIKVVNQRKFMDYYLIGDHAIVCSHGKDDSNLKFGLKVHLDAKHIEKIDQYLKSHDVYNYAKYIEFSKGDSHQALFDLSGSDDFDYFNYPAFSPSSGWVQTNFKKGRSGFVLQHIHKYSDIKEIKPFFFEWKK